MSDFNHVFISGRLTRDVDVVDLPGGSKVGKFGIASNRVYFNKDKEKQEETTFLDCQLFGANRVDWLAENAKKGTVITLTGRLSYDSWEDSKDGSKRSKTLLTVDDFKTPPSPKGDSEPTKTEGKAAAKGKQSKTKDNDDIPF